MNRTCTFLAYALISVQERLKIKDDKNSDNRKPGKKGFTAHIERDVS